MRTQMYHPRRRAPKVGLDKGKEKVLRNRGCMNDMDES